MSDQTILLHDLERIEAQRASGLIAVLEAAGYKVTYDALNRPQVSTADGLKWLEAQAQAGARAVAEATRIAAIEASLNRGEAPRDPESRKVFEKHYARAQRKGYPDGVAAEVARTAVRSEILGTGESTELPAPTYTWAGHEEGVREEVH